MNEMEKALKKHGIISKKTGTPKRSSDSEELEALLKIQKSLSFIKWQLTGLAGIITIGYLNVIDVLR